MSTPLQRARTKLRVMYRLQQAARDHQEHGLEEGEEARPPPTAPKWNVRYVQSAAATSAISPIMDTSAAHVACCREQATLSCIHAARCSRCQACELANRSGVPLPLGSCVGLARLD